MNGHKMAQKWIILNSMKMDSNCSELALKLSKIIVKLELKRGSKKDQKRTKKDQKGPKKDQKRTKKGPKKDQKSI